MNLQVHTAPDLILAYVSLTWYNLYVVTYQHGGRWLKFSRVRNCSLHVVWLQVAAKEYFCEEEEWKSPKEIGPIGSNLALGAVVDEIHSLADEPEMDLQYLGLIRYSLMLACVGVPFSGAHLMTQSVTSPTDDHQHWIFGELSFQTLESE